MIYIGTQKLKLFYAFEVYLSLIYTRFGIPNCLPNGHSFDFSFRD
jgi:hypothetical protein